MRWEYLGLMLLIMMTVARFGMAHHLFQSREDDDGRTFPEYLDASSVTDYIRITREESGRIGEWFWVFASSALMLMIVVIAALTGEPILSSPLPPPDQDFLWPLL